MICNSSWKPIQFKIEVVQPQRIGLRVSSLNHERYEIRNPRETTMNKARTASSNHFHYFVCRFSSNRLLFHSSLQYPLSRRSLVELGSLEVIERRSSLILRFIRYNDRLSRACASLLLCPSVFAVRKWILQYAAAFAWAIQERRRDWFVERTANSRATSR